MGDGQVGRDVVQILQMPAGADAGGAGLRIQRLEQAVETYGCVGGIQTGIRGEGTGLDAQLCLDAHGHVFAGVHVLKQLLVAKLQTLGTGAVEAVHNHGILPGEEAVGGIEHRGAVTDIAGGFTLEGEAQPHGPVLIFCGDNHRQLGLQLLGVDHFNGDVQGGGSHGHLAAQYAAAAVVAHAAALATGVVPICIGLAAGVPLGYVSGGKGIFTIVYGVNIAVVRVIFNNPVVSRNLRLQCAFRQQNIRGRGLLVVHGVQTGVGDCGFPVAGLHGSVVNGHGVKPRGAAAGLGQLRNADLICPVVGVHFCQPVLGSDIDVLGNGVQLVLPQGCQQTGGGDGRQSYQHGDDGNHRQQLRQRKAHAGSAPPSGCGFRDFDSSHTAYSPSLKRYAGTLLSAENGWKRFLMVYKCIMIVIASITSP